MSQMTVDIRDAARNEAFRDHYSHKQVPDRYDADLLIAGFQDGAVWAQAQLTPAREQIADAITNRPLGVSAADAVLALLQAQAGRDGA